MNCPAIVIPVFNRVKSLERLLKSIVTADLNKFREIPLVFVIDYSSSQNEIFEIIEGFNWEFGQKRIIRHQSHLGLRENILFCGDLTKEYSQIILLEDDLIVGPHFYSFAQQSLDNYQNDDLIGGVSLYNYITAEPGLFPFYPIEDGTDIYFLQIASSWGQAWTSSQWTKFRSWYGVNKNDIISLEPSYTLEWNNSWKKYFITYLWITGRYFVFPRKGHSTHPGEIGTNTVWADVFQSPLSMGLGKISFSNPKESVAVYDPFFEWRGFSKKSGIPLLDEAEFEMDLYGLKKKRDCKHQRVLSVKNGTKPLLQIGRGLVPPEMNLFFPDEERIGLSLYEVEEVDFNFYDPFWNFGNLSAVKNHIFSDRLTEEVEELSGIKAKHLAWDEAPLIAKKLFKDYKQEFDLDQESPGIVLLVFPSKEAEELEEIIKEMNALDYRKIKVLIYGKNPEGSGNGYCETFSEFLDNSSGYQLVLPISENKKFKPSEIAQILEAKSFSPSVDYYLGVSQDQLPQKEINSLRIDSRTAVFQNMALQATIPIQQLNSFHLEKQKKDLKETISHFFGYKKPSIIVSNSFSPSFLSPLTTEAVLAPLNEDLGLVDKVTRFLFINNVPLFKHIFPSSRYLIPVIRKEGKKPLFYSNI